MRRRSLLAVLAVAALTLSACHGTLDPDVNAGAPVTLPSWQFDTHEVLRFPDGSMLVSRLDFGTGDELVQKLAADGTVDASWGTGGVADVGFRPNNASSGFTDGVVLADGSVLLFGGRTQYTSGVIRLDPTGSLDTDYGDAGFLETEDLFSGASFGPCQLAASGNVHCGGLGFPGSGQIVAELRSVDAAGDLVGQLDVPLDLDAFRRPAGPGETGALAAFPTAYVRAGADSFLVLQVSTTYRDGDGFYVGASEIDTVVVAIDGATRTVDTSFGADGYALLDLEGAGDGSVTSGAGAWDTQVYELEPAGDGTVLLLAAVRDGTGTGETRYALVRLTAAGAVDTSFGGGLVHVTDAGGTPVAVQGLEARGDTDYTLVGRTGTLPTSTGVVLRYLGDGSLDPDFGTDGVATVPGAEDLSGLDLRNGRVTVGGFSTGSAPEGDAVVAVLRG